MVGGLAKTRAGLAQRLGGVWRADRIDESHYEEIEEGLLAADVGVEATMRLVDALRERARKDRPEDGRALRALLVRQIEEELASCAKPWREPSPGEPAAYVMVGVNGVGKTTTAGKLAARYCGRGLRVLLGAADTFRAAAGEQLAVWAERAGAQIVGHESGGDPGAVAFDAAQAARSRNADVLIIDTAGRLHTKENLMAELGKVVRVTERAWGAPVDEILLVIDATTGQNGLAQAKRFSEAVGVTGVALTKLDGSAKGGVVLAVSAALGVPVKWIGVGEQVGDLRPFDPAGFARALLEGDGLGGDGPAPNS